MALARDAYKALEDVLGPENISEDPVVIESYAFPMRSGAAGGSGLETDTRTTIPRFEAITLPKDTREVQAIVRLCNKYKIQFKASSTG